MYVMPLSDEHGQVERIAIYSSVLTRTIKASRENGALVGALMRSTAVIDFSLEGMVLPANQNFLDGMGCTLAKIQGKHHQIFCLPDYAQSAEYKEFRKTPRRGNYVAGRFCRIDNQGQEVWLEASYNPVLAANGKLYKIVKLAMVISDQVKRENAVDEGADMAHGNLNAHRYQCPAGPRGDPK